MSASATYLEFYNCISDLINTSEVQSMMNLPQHGSVSCLEHSVFVSYISYRIAKRLGYDYVAAARGGLLHDLFLYDWREKGSHEGLHGFSHPVAALENAEKLTELSEVERDIILKHMWPLTITKMPKFAESFIVNFSDKLCAMTEATRLYQMVGMRRRLQFVPQY